MTIEQEDWAEEDYGKQVLVFARNDGIWLRVVGHCSLVLSQTHAKRLVQELNAAILETAPNNMDKVFGALSDLADDECEGL